MKRPEGSHDRIVLEGMEFHAHHGVFAEEARFGSRFRVDVELGLQLSGSDRLAETVDYSRVYELVREVVTGQRFQLIEALASELAGRILADFGLADTVLVRVHKPQAPLPGVFRDVFAEVRRQR